ncbi:hypothetical protein WMF28_22735 [Sorangium sp. So ce590]|uniref:hypothetical protein n=1 Tax=Sorangium sp. So ce590 TaxID=3133317 RepID=UPI003F62EF06
MKRAGLLLSALAGVLLAPSAARAQAAAESMLRGAPGDDHLRARVTLDPGFMVGLGYVRGIDVGHGRARRLGLHVDLDALIDFSSWDLTGGLSARLFDRPGFDVLGRVDLDLKLAQNEAHTALAYGYRLTLAPGFYRPKWYAAAGAGFRGNIATTMWQSASYLEQFPEAKDGTYLSGTALFSFGVTAGLRFGRRYFSGVRAAYRLPATLESYGPWVQPMTVGVELGGTFSLWPWT